MYKSNFVHLKISLFSFLIKINLFSWRGPSLATAFQKSFKDYENNMQYGRKLKR